MKIDRKELQDALEKVKPALANRELIEQATSFAFMGDRVVTFNDEISISHPVEDLDVRGAITAEKLYKFLDKIKREEIDVEWEQNQVKITAGRSTAGLVFEEEIKLPVEEIGEIGDWQPLPEGVIEGLKFCYPCCSTDMSRPVFTCVHARDDVVEATDSYQIVQYQLDGEIPIDRFLMPASAVKELVKYDGVKEIAEGQGWIHFRTAGDTIFSSRVFHGKFPDISQFLEFDGVEVAFPKTTIRALERAEVFSRADFTTGDMPMVTVRVEDGKIKISAEDEDGWFQEEIPARYDGEPVQFATNVNFLAELLTQTSICSFSQERIRFTGEDWTHVVATIADEG